VKIRVIYIPRPARQVLLYFISLMIFGLLAMTDNALPAEPQQPRYAVQVGVFIGPIQSNRLAEELSLAGYSAWMEERSLSNANIRYYVLVGPFTDRAQAGDTLRSISRKFKLEPFIIDLDQY
jgi:cell division septation protein DedD